MTVGGRRPLRQAFPHQETRRNHARARRALEHPRHHTSPGRGGAAGGTPAPSSSAVVAGSTLLVERALSEGRRNFDALGRSWDLLPGVFSPALTSSTGFYTRHLPFPQGAASWRSAAAPG
ncbi:hypothetical protein HFP72_18350 [Nocardiopsis sp. ARC36]